MLHIGSVVAKDFLSQIAVRLFAAPSITILFGVILPAHPVSSALNDELRMDADSLRIILALVGGLVLAGLYLWERRRSTGDDEDRDTGDPDVAGRQSGGGKREPSLGPWEERGVHEKGSSAATPDSVLSTQSGGLEDGRQPEFELEPPPAPPKEPAPEFPSGPMLLTLHVVARAEPFEGGAIVQAAGHCGLEPGEMEIFHCCLGDEDHRQTLFRMANMVKPGTFPFGAMAEFTSPGLTLFAELDGTHDDPGRMEELLGTAHTLAEELDGELLDENREPFTTEVERRLRDRVMSFVEVRLTANPA
jgi:cell division protein ZipA